MEKSWNFNQIGKKTKNQPAIVATANVQSTFPHANNMGEVCFTWKSQYTDHGNLYTCMHHGKVMEFCHGKCADSLVQHIHLIYCVLSCCITRIMPNQHCQWGSNVLTAISSTGLSAQCVRPCNQ